MKAWVAKMTEEHLDEDAIRRAGEILKDGGLVAFPTETGVLFICLTAENTQTL